MLSIDFSDPFKSEAVIDSWFTEASRGSITDICSFEDFALPTLIAVTNVVVASGSWESPFEENKTALRTFYDSDTTSMQVQTMYKLDHYCRSCKVGRLGSMTFIVLHTHERHLSMSIFLPDSDSSLPVAISELDANILSSLSDSVIHIEEAKEIYLPKFKLRNSFEMKPILRELGIEEVLNSGVNFSNMLNGNYSNSSFVEFPRHVAEISVHEKGFEAGVNAVADLPFYADRGQPIIFNANRPFFFTIVDNSTGLILFCGRVMRPVLED